MGALGRSGRSPLTTQLRLAERSRVDVLGSLVDDVDMRAAADRIASLIANGTPAQVVTFGAEMAIHALRYPSYRDAVNAADLVVADTVGVVWAARMLGTPLPERVAGIELVERLCEAGAGPVYFLGAAEGVAAGAAAALSSRHPALRVAGSHHGFFADAESDAIAGAIRASGARLVLVALGMPRQEFWIRQHLSALGAATCIGVGGAFDVWAGKAVRAPASWRRAGFEWLYRLLREPSRIGRQLVLPEFALRVLVQALRKPNKPL
jgi:N-acetylglucosaminyldiphosphoundecaprenol N-acetyl-beta-D-mannosaminyltransferase